jgi:hypothetical protein
MLTSNAWSELAIKITVCEIVYGMAKPIVSGHRGKVDQSLEK